MSKFCGSCGASMEDDARVCGACGAPFATENASAPVNPANPVNPTMPVNPVNNVTNPVASMSADQKKKLTIIAVAAGAGFVAIIALIIVLNIVLSNTGYKGTMNKYFNAIEDYDVDAATELISDATYATGWYDYDEAEFEENKKDYVKENVSSTLESFEDKVGNKVKIKYEIVDAEKISDRKYDEFLETLEEVYDYDTSNITKVMEVDYTLNLKGKKNKRTVYPPTMYLIKEDGKWTVYQGSLLY